MYAWHQRPAIDCLMNQYREDTHAQFGNIRMVGNCPASPINSDASGPCANSMAPAAGTCASEDMKRIGDWLEVLGVNTLDEHLSYITIRGAGSGIIPVVLLS